MQTLNFPNLSASQLAQLTTPPLPMFHQPIPSNLNKRSSEQFEATCQEELQKKLKTAYSAINIPMVSNMRPNPQHILAEMERYQHIQNFRFLLNMNQEFQKNFMNAPKTAMKEEFAMKDSQVKQEETTGKSPTLMASKWTSDQRSETCLTAHDTLSETSECKIESGVPVKEPVLVEYTKAFPDWDIATIFSFLQSGKSKESFEKEKEFRAERKKRRAAKRKQQKLKDASSIKVKVL